ncbi:MAG: glycosyltransferase [Verrucomicrobiota bacterium]|nr:glycosyltransferase [Verrucomicrobiota bacterium]
MTALVLLALAFSAGPAILFRRNLRVFHPPELIGKNASTVAILIPARDEERNIRAAVEAALANDGAEVLVLDDASTDRTREIVTQIAQHEPRLRLLAGAALPSGWIGKNWACTQLANATDRHVLLFADADVRLAPHAANSLAAWMRANHAHLASGVPWQQMGTFTERLLVPVIHFVLLGFLPLARMRRSPHIAYATGCGQLVIADAAAYRQAGGHASIRGLIHDGLALPKRFRAAGFRTDLFDATAIASCRMYRSNAETWRGFAKNTHEGLGAPARIIPATCILLLGQVSPFVLLVFAARFSMLQFIGALIAAACALLPRLLAAKRFRQPIVAVVLHPLAIITLLAIQWVGLLRLILHRPVRWKARTYSGAESAGDGVPLADAGEQIPQRI